MEQNPPSENAPKRRSLLLNSRFWSLVVTIAISVTFLYDHVAFLKEAETASFDTAAYIENHLSPGSFARAFDERAGACDYHWLFVCESPPPRVVCRSSALGFADCMTPADTHSLFDPNRYRRGRSDTGLLSAVWSGFLTLCQVPDAAWYVVKKAWLQGILDFALLLAFLVINLFVATRFPLAALPIVFPLGVALSSGLFWILQQLLVLAAGAVGVVFFCLVLIAGVPSAIVTVFGWIEGEHSLRGFVHEVRKALGFAKEIVPHGE